MIRMMRSLCTLLLLSMLISCRNNQPVTNGTDATGADRKWWKEAVVYQIYPRSFKEQWPTSIPY